MQLTDQQKHFKLNLEQKQYAFQLLDSFGIDKCIKCIDALIVDCTHDMDYLQAHLYHLLLKHIIYLNDESQDMKADKDIQEHYKGFDNSLEFAGDK